MVYSKALVALTTVALANAHIGDLTHYDPSVGIGSCGWQNYPNEMVVALSPQTMGNGADPNKNPKCGQEIDIYNPHNSKKALAVIVDTCAGCTGGSIDVTDAVWLALGSSIDSVTDAGRIPNVQWNGSGLLTLSPRDEEEKALDANTDPAAAEITINQIVEPLDANTTATAEISINQTVKPLDANTTAAAGNSTDQPVKSKCNKYLGPFCSVLSLRPTCPWLGPLCYVLGPEIHPPANSKCHRFYRGACVVKKDAAAAVAAAPAAAAVVEKQKKKKKKKQKRWDTCGKRLKVRQDEVADADERQIIDETAEEKAQYEGVVNALVGIHKGDAEDMRADAAAEAAHANIRRKQRVIDEVVGLKFDEPDGGDGVEPVVPAAIDYPEYPPQWWPRRLKKREMIGFGDPVELGGTEYIYPDRNCCPWYWKPCDYMRPPE